MSHQLVNFVKIGDRYSITIEDRKFNLLCNAIKAAESLLVCRMVSVSISLSTGKVRGTGTLSSLGNGLQHFKGGS